MVTPENRFYCSWFLAAALVTELKVWHASNPAWRIMGLSNYGYKYLKWGYKS